MTVVSAAVGVGAVTSFIGAKGAQKAANRATDAASAAAEEQAALGREQLALSREQFEKGEARQAKLDPLYEQLMTSSIQDSDIARNRSADQWDQYTRVFQPLEGKMASTAANYDTAGRRNAAAAEAMATTSKAFDATQAAQTRGLQRAGVQMGSGRALALGNQSRLDEAKALAGADIAARRAVEDRGIALVDNAARFGRNQTSTSLQAAGVGLQANGVAQNAGLSGAQAAAASLSPALSLMSAGSGNIGSAGNAFNGIAANQQQAANQAYAGIGSALSTGAYLYGRGGFGSINPGFSGTQAPAPVVTMGVQP